MRILVKFAYNGRNYYGYARQPNLKTVEGSIIKGLVKHGLIKNTKDAYFRSASRTDKGVSALGNVIGFNTPASKKHVIESLRNEFSSIFLYSVTAVDPEFNPRYAKLRHYRYYLRKKNINIEKIISAAAFFIGEHDFSNFARLAPYQNPVKILDNIVVEEDEDFFIIDFYAQGFLWHQIRRIISALEKLGTNKIEKQQIINALYNPGKKADLGLAPAEPLILKDIRYDFSFEFYYDYLPTLGAIEKDIVTSITQ